MRQALRRGVATLNENRQRLEGYFVVLREVGAQCQLLNPRPAVVPLTVRRAASLIRNWPGS